VLSDHRPASLFQIVALHELDPNSTRSFDEREAHRRSARKHERSGLGRHLDVLGFQRWCQPFVWIGMNSIAIYLAENITGGFNQISVRFVGGEVKAWFDLHVAQGFGDLIVTAAGLLLAVLFLRFLYRRKIFIKL